MSSLFDSDIERAIQVCLVAHWGQNRKGSKIPYASHPVHIALILTRLGASSTVIQAGLLHDVVEDCRDWTRDRVAQEFGAEVSDLVEELTETGGEPWEARKQAAIDKTGTMSHGAAMIKAADKLHNLSTLAIALENADDRDEVWKHFSRGPEATFAMSTQLIDGLAGRVPDAVALELRAVLARLEALH